MLGALAHGNRETMPAIIVDVRTELATLAEEAAANECIVPDTVIAVPFCGVTLQIPSADACSEVNFRLEAALKDLSMGFDGGVTPLPHEEWLFPERAGKPAVVGKDLLADNEVARTHFLTQARRGANTMMCQFTAMVSQEKKGNTRPSSTQITTLSSSAKSCSFATMPRSSATYQCSTAFDKCCQTKTERLALMMRVEK